MNQKISLLPKETKVHRLLQSLKLVYFFDLEIYRWQIYGCVKNQITKKGMLKKHSVILIKTNMAFIVNHPKAQ